MSVLLPIRWYAAELIGNGSHFLEKAMVGVTRTVGTRERRMRSAVGRLQ